MALIKARGAPASSAVEMPKYTLLEQFKERVKLDRHTLDLAAEEQPQLFLDVADQHVFAQSRHDAARNELLRVDARLGREVRADMVAKAQKPTEGSVADVVLGNEEHIKADNAMAAAKIEADEWGVLRSSLEHRKSMIRELALLYAAGYYTAGAARDSSNKNRDARAAEGREALAKSRAERSA